MLGGQRVEVSYAGNQWQTSPAIFARIDWIGGNSNGVRDFGGWVVTTPDETRYEFGDSGSFTGFQPNSANAYSLEQTTGGDSYRLTRRWYLRKVTDTAGNSMEYTYKGEQRAKTCQVEDQEPDNWVAKGLNWYTSSIDLARIEYSANRGQGASGTSSAPSMYTCSPTTGASCAAIT